MKGHRHGQCSIKQTLSERDEKKKILAFLHVENPPLQTKARANVHYSVAKHQGDFKRKKQKEILAFLHVETRHFKQKHVRTSTIKSINN